MALSTSMSPRAAGVVIALWLFLAVFASGALADSAPDRPENTAEIQLGGGGAFATATEFFPLLQVHARYSFWRTLGPGAYLGIIWTDRGGANEAIVPLCARINLSLPFWRSFEPVASLGLGTYWTSVAYASGTRSDFSPGGHLALAFLFMGEKRGLGVEGAVHVREDEVYSGEVEAIGTVAVSVVFR